MAMNKTLLLAALIASVAGAASAQDAAQGNATRGKQLYYANTCYGCHGFNGQTGARNLVGTSSPIIATQEAFITFLRGRSNFAPMVPSTAMPTFPKSAISDAQAADIYAYIKTFKLDAPDVKDIPAYAQIQASAAKGFKAGK
jgi:mono/diheme cytochrome c family protein